jgi:hypothetical protein
MTPSSQDEASILLFIRIQSEFLLAQRCHRFLIMDAPKASDLKHFESLPVLVQYLWCLSEAMFTDDKFGLEEYHMLQGGLSDIIDNTTWGLDFESFLLTMNMQQVDECFGQFRQIQLSLSLLDHVYGNETPHSQALFDDSIMSLQARKADLTRDQTSARFVQMKDRILAEALVHVYGSKKSSDTEGTAPDSTPQN